MALKLLSTRKLNGFTKGTVGDNFFSENMLPQAGGMIPFMTHSLNFTTSPDPIYTFSQIRALGQDFIYGISNSASFYKYASSTWSKWYTSASFSFYGGIADQKNRMLLVSAQRLALYEESGDYTTGTITVTNGSANVTGTGTTWTSGMSSFRILIGSDTTSYTFTYVSGTSGTLNTNYTGTSGTYTYRIYTGMTESWKNFGTSLGSYVPCEIYEDTVLFGRGNNITTLNTLTDTITTDSAPSFSMPSGYNCRCISANSNGILLGFNFNNKGVLVLWDNFSDRSIAPWIWTNGNILSIVKFDSNWLVITQREIILTNGYSSQIFTLPIDTPETKIGFAVYPQGASISGDTLIIAQNDPALTQYFSNGTGSSLVFGRNRAGFLTLNLKTKKWGFISASGVARGLELTAIFQDNITNKIWTGFRKGVQLGGGNDTKHIGQLEYSVPSQAYLITEPLGVGMNKKHTEAIIPELSMESLFNSDGYGINFTLTAKVAPYTSKLFTYAIQVRNESVATQVCVNGTLSGKNNASVGDEVTIIEGVNAGAIRHITAITGAGTSTEIWTLDSALSNNMEQNAYMVISPFRKVGMAQTFTDATELKDLFFNDKNKVKGRKFLVKLLFTGITNIAPKIDAVHFAYDDLGEY